MIMDGLLRAFNDPFHDCRCRLGNQILGIVLDITVSADPSIEGDHDEPAPDSGVHGADPRQMIGIQDKGVRRPEFERIGSLMIALH